MKLLFTLMLIAGFGFWLMKEYQHEKELETELADTHQALEEAQKQLGLYQSRGPQQMNSGVSPNKQWMWGKSLDNPLNEPAKPAYH